MLNRPRRLRKNSIMREMVAETHLSKNMFVYPYFIVPGKNVMKPIKSMPSINHFSADTLLLDVEKNLKLGINKIMLFGIGEEKFADARSTYNPNSVISKAVRLLKQKFSEEIYIITDVCTCAYTTHGHCGILQDGYVDNDKTLEVLSKMAVAHAQAGVDMVAPSDMMDGRIRRIREGLNLKGFQYTGIMSYAIKFASAYYGPFRQAANSNPEKGDRKSYQMDFRNYKEALKEAMLDEQEGADILMVKPALAYTDIIRLVKDNTLLPVACYNVSAEYSMVKEAARKGFIEESNIVMENMYAFARAGANIIITYHAKDIVKNNWL